MRRQFLLTRSKQSGGYLLSFADFVAPAVASRIFRGLVFPLVQLGDTPHATMQLFLSSQSFTNERVRISARGRSA